MEKNFKDFFDKKGSVMETKSFSITHLAAAEEFPNIRVVDNPSFAQPILDELPEGAIIHFQESGFEQRLILEFEGRSCIIDVIRKAVSILSDPEDDENLARECDAISNAI